MGMIAVFFILSLAGCSTEPVQQEPAGRESSSTQTEAIDTQQTEEEHGAEARAEMLILPRLQAAELDGEALKVIATTSIIGDVVAQVGGETIELKTLMAPGQDPHSYVPAARDLTAVAGADVIFVNGWDLEEGLLDDLKSIGEDAPIVPISAGIVPLAFGDATHDHAPDPHVWLNVHHVEQWAANVQQAFSTLDPAKAMTYEENVSNYLNQLEELQAYTEAQLTGIPEENRFLVTNHDSLNYFADEYGFTLLGTVIPAASTLAEPSASDLARLTTTIEEHGLCTIFTETAVSDTLAQTVAGELGQCDEVKVLPLFTGSIGPTGSGADSYISMFRANIDSIVSGLE